MRKPLKSHIPMTLIVICCLLFSFTPTARTFTSPEHHVLKKWRNNLIKKVHADHWVISYKYGDDCTIENRPAQKDLEAAITKALQVWLRPLRDMETKHPIVNEFRYKGGVNVVGASNLRLLFYCGEPKHRSGALVFDKAEWDPFVEIDAGTDVNHPFFIYVLIHELGHAMGLGDTYARGGNWTTKGGLNITAGTQPAAAMVWIVFPYTNQHLTEDDKNGIVWLYKVEHEGLDRGDCFFSNYKFEAVPAGCVPKSPLIFEIRQGHTTFARQVLNDDRNIDLNAQDDTGATALIHAIKGRHWQIAKELFFRIGLNVNLRDESGSTALHYAILQGDTEIVEALLSHEEIWVRPRNKAGKTPIDFARDLGDEKTLELLLTHPNQHLSVAPKGKLATTWGNLKRGN